MECEKWHCNEREREGTDSTKKINIYVSERQVKKKSAPTKKCNINLHAFRGKNLVLLLLSFNIVSDRSCQILYFVADTMKTFYASRKQVK